MLNLTPQQLRKAADIQEKIQSLQEELNDILGGGVSTPAARDEQPKKRKMSAAGRAAIAAGARARWAKIKGTASSPEPAKKVKRTAAWRAAISAAAKARWAKAKKAGKSSW